MSETRHNIFGEDRDDAPGITMVPGKMPPQITDAMSESSAIHSKSRGWIPAIILSFAAEDGTTFKGVIEVNDALADIVENIGICCLRAGEDVRIGIEKGILK